MKTEEAQLVEDCLKNDQNAFKRLYDRYASSMYGVCLRYSRTTAAAEDVLHDGFIKVFECLSQLRDVSSLSSWIRSIMIHTAINNYRKEMPVAESDFEGAYIDDPFPSTGDMADDIDMDFLLNVIQQLPPAYRMTFNLCEVECYSVEEAAEALGITISTVRSNLYRAKAILSEKLSPYLKK
ncbi:MAG: RNA polymerase sigma factor [Bacteroidales bacterium]|nr:RNA polymerase sigma factor [Bacteroidales bacterium]